MAGTGFGAAAPTSLVRSWRTAFLTLRDETLTIPSRNSNVQLLDNLILSHSKPLVSAAVELPSHEVLSDILFMMELVAATSSDEEDCTRIYAQTSRLIHDICRCVSFDLNFSSYSSVLNCFGKMLNLFLRNVATNGDISGICSTTTIIPAIECLQAVRFIIISHRRWLQSEDVMLVKFLLDVIICSHGVSFWMPHSICKEKSTRINMRFSIERSSSELQTVAFEMLSEAISRAGSSLPVDIWRSILEVFRKTMDVLALKSPVVEDSVMSRFYESFLCCLHLILIDPKCAVLDHVSVFVAVLRMFLVYGLSGRTLGTSLLVGHKEKELNSMSPKASRELLKKSDHGTYRPPHLRKRDCLNVKHGSVRHSQYMSDSESSTINVTSSDSEFSDGDGSANDSGRVQSSRVRVAAITCIQDLCQADSKSLSMQWSLLLPTSDALQARMHDATLMTCLLFDPCLKARMASAATLVTMMDGLSSIFLQVAEYKESNKLGSFMALSSSLGTVLLELHRGLLYLIEHEAHTKLLALLFRIIKLLISSTPGHVMNKTYTLKDLERHMEQRFIRNLDVIVEGGRGHPIYVEASYKNINSMVN
uniref:DUF4042 domain-containing protein n=1 Tax=Phaseolus vulgaris TaxID=3885 RepID=V7AJ67_PHAVU|nr:hypothetical protein PHAVU_011G167600g [Phaseolus vulgaris]ESW05290.1 hypothetical protein PHAVU_011G167600g [Phaseolus vulgaris]